MVEKKPLLPKRTREISGSFAFIEHRFLRDGFWHTLSHQELLLYFFLILVADRNGLSFYGFDKICTLLQFSVEEYIESRNGLIEKDLIAFDGHLFQVLSLPAQSLIKPPALLQTQEDMEQGDPATIHQSITNAFGRNP